MTRIPVTTSEDLRKLDEAEVLEGYLDGRADEPEPRGNRSRAYWHGWRNGMVDGGHQAIDGAQMVLAHAVAPGGKLTL